jgi:hypothetical protein
VLANGGNHRLALCHEVNDARVNFIQTLPEFQ